MNLIKPFRINSLKTMMPFLQKRHTMASSLTVPMPVPMPVPMASPLIGDFWANVSCSQYDSCCLTCKHFIKTYDKKFDIVSSGKCNLYYYIDDDKQVKYKDAIDENYEMRCKGYLWEMR